MEIRAIDNKLEIEGYVTVVERKSRVLTDSNGTKFVEEVRSGCFSRALANNDKVLLLLNHDPRKVLGDTQSNVELREDNVGLHIKATIEDETVISAYNNGVQFSGFSFGFKALNDHREPYKYGLQLRTLNDIYLSEVSLLDETRTPAYTCTLVNVETRDDSNEIIELRDIDTNDNSIEEQRQLFEEEQKLKLKQRQIEIELELL